MELPPADFESAASTSFTTSANDKNTTTYNYNKTNEKYFLGYGEIILEVI